MCTYTHETDTKYARNTGHEIKEKRYDTRARGQFAMTTWECRPVTIIIKKNLAE